MATSPSLIFPTADGPIVPLREQPSAARRFLQPAAAAGLGLGVMLLQLALACSLCGEIEPSRAYMRLFQWDSRYYEAIADDGYHCPPAPTVESRGNVAFFPGYPLSAWLIRSAAGWPMDVCLLVAAQLACWGLWTYVILLFQRWRVPGGLAVLGCLLALSRPAAFFLTAAYSESLFLMSLLGFVYWSGARSRFAPFLAALHGFVLTATRIAGLPVVVYPIVHAWLNGPREAGAGHGRNVARLLPALAVAVFAALGAGLFFLYCHVRFGRWDLYMQTQNLGWDVQPDYLAFLDGSAYQFRFPPALDRYFDPDWFNRVFSLLFLPLFAGLLVAEHRLARSAPATGWRERAGLYLAAWLVYYVAVSGTSHLGLTSMTRYVFGPEMLLMLCLIHMLSRVRRSPTWLRVGLAVWALFGLFYQVVCIVRFTRGYWVA